MPNETISTIIAKINKLRELATKNTNPNEAASAAAVADALISKFQLSEADLIVKGEANAEPIVIIREPLHESGRVMLWIKQLASVLCEHYGCSYYVNTAFDPQKAYEKNPKAKRASFQQFIVVGRRSDYAVVSYFFTWLKDVINELIKNNARGMGMEHSQNYGLGCVEGIRFQLANEANKLRAQAATLGQSAAMVLLDKRAVEAEAFMKVSIKLTNAVGSKLGGNYDAFSQGKEQGKRIQLNKGIGSGGGPNKLLK